MPTSTLLTPEIERNLARAILDRSQGQMAMTKAQALDEARIRRARYLKVPRMEVKPFSYAWLQGFIKRHPEIEGCFGRTRHVRCFKGEKPVVDRYGNLSFVQGGSGAVRRPLGSRN